MPRTARASVGGICYHVLNRGNGRAKVFHKDADYAAFVQLLADANERLPRVKACLTAVFPVFRLATGLRDRNDENELGIDLIDDRVCESSQHHEPMIVIVGRERIRIELHQLQHTIDFILKSYRGSRTPLVIPFASQSVFAIGFRVKDDLNHGRHPVRGL